MTSNGISIAQACRQLEVSEKELRAMMADGRLPYRRVNRSVGRRGRIVIRHSDVLALLKPSQATATICNPRIRGVIKGSERFTFAKPPAEITG